MASWTYASNVCKFRHLPLKSNLDTSKLLSNKAVEPPARQEARMDLVVHAPHFPSPFYIDLTVVSALSSDALAGGSAIRAGAAAEIGARGKFRDYPNCTLTPFVVEDHGRLGEEALRFVRLIAPDDPSERSKAIKRLHQSLGATLQRTSAEAIIAATTVRQ